MNNFNVLFETLLTEFCHQIDHPMHPLVVDASQNSVQSRLGAGAYGLLDAWFDADLKDALIGF